MGLTQVSTDGVKNDAITKTKIPANQIEASELADNAVDTNAIADQAVALSKLPHGDGSSNGKFLRANNGADPSFETVSIPAGTTINNNADNRVITGSGSANTLNGESSVVIDANGKLAISGTNSNDANNTTNGVGFTSGTFHHRSRGSSAGISGQTYSNQLISSNGTNVALELYTIGATGTPVVFGTNSTEKMRIQPDGRLGLGTNNPNQLAHFYHATDNGLLRLESGDSQARIMFDDNAGETHLGAVGSDTVMWQGSGLAETLRVANGGEVTKPRTPFFWAYNSSNYSWNNNTISFETEANDVGGNYNNSTYTFTCPTAGVYVFVVYFRSGGGFSEFSWTLQKNGGDFIRIIGQGSYAGNDCHFGTTIQAASANDTWRVHGSGSHGGATGGYQYNGFQGYLLG